MYGEDETRRRRNAIICKTRKPINRVDNGSATATATGKSGCARQHGYGPVVVEEARKQAGSGSR